MKLEKPCIPWYFPKNDTSSLRLCNPWEAMDFRKIMDTTPVNFYSHCLTDCSGIIYQASVTAAPFSRCDFKNIGVSDLCNFDVQINPTIWGQSVMDQYGDEVEKAKKKLETSDEDTSEGDTIPENIPQEETSGGEKKKERKGAEKEITIPEYITKGIITNLRKHLGKIPFFSSENVCIRTFPITQMYAAC